MIRCFGGRCSQTTRWTGPTRGAYGIRWRSISTKKSRRGLQPTAEAEADEGSSATDIWEVLAANGLKNPGTQVEWDGTGKVTANASQNAPESLPASNDKLRTTSQPPLGPLATKPSRLDSLPISPLMDPSFHAAREEHRLPKKPPSKETMTAYQTKLAKNPYARALATPVRRCKITLAALPSFFLQDVNTIQDPETGEPWLMPRSLTKGSRVDKHDEARELDFREGFDEGGIVEKSLGIEGEAPGRELDSETDQQVKLTNTVAAETTPKCPSKSAKDLLPKSTPSIGITGYAISSYNLINDFSNDGSNIKGKRRKNKSQQAGAFWKNGRYLRLPNFARAASKIQWRPDMADLILELMRRRIVELIVLAYNKKRGYLTIFDSDKPGNLRMAGAVLYFGVDGEKGKAIGEYHVLNNVPVYDMRLLLGAEKIQWLREQTTTHGVVGKPESLFSKEIVLLRNKRMTVNLLMRLWKLRGYLAEHLPEDIDTNSVTEDAA